MVKELLQNHSSVRIYDGNPISKEIIEELISTAQMAATSHFVQAYSVIWVTDAEKKEKLGLLSGNPRQYETSGGAFVFCVDFKRLQSAGKLEGVDIVADSAENVLVGVADVSLFAQNFVVAAESMGYGICYIGGVRNKPEEISELFNLPDYVFPLFGLTIGVPARRNEVKPRLPVAAVLHENEYNADKYEELLPAYNDTMETYYNNRSSNRKIDNWTKQMADFLIEQRRPHINEFLAKKGFSWK
ncbi:MULTISPECIES: class II chromate reductase ChrR [unclassified Lysinibacillus]|uniref:class II chromate reductase ChrR n=1 Tax=unclassified Lysinibacillus TaxID=2636778 RepID=UPI0037F9C04C